MYIVVSKWEPLPGHESQFRQSGEVMQPFMRSQPGVEFIESFKASDNTVTVIHAYTDEDAYNRIVNDPNGEFQRRLEQAGSEKHAKWISSERGYSLVPNEAMKSGSATVR
jgi:hypothetical protein